MPKISDEVVQNIIEIEQTILAIALNDPNTISRIVNKLSGEYFIKDEDRIIFNAIRELSFTGANIDPLILANFIHSSDMYQFDNISEYLVELNAIFVHSLDLDTYMEALTNFSISKKLNKFGKDLIDMDLDFRNFNDSMWDLEKNFMQLVKSKNTSDFATSDEIAKQYQDKLMTIKKNRGTLTGTCSGYACIDKFTNGFQPGDLIILAARPSIGKTALALNMILNAAKECKEDECVVMFSLEMGADQLYQRLVSCESGIPSTILRDGTWSDNDEYVIYQAIQKIAALPIYVDDSSNISIMEIQSKLNQLKSNKKKVKLIIVDYLQLVQGSTKAGTNRQQEVSQISRFLKSIARDLESPLIAIAQLSRKIEERKGSDKKPMLSDLRESGAIEQDADLVTFLNYERDEVDNEKSTEKQKTYLQNVIVDFIIAKHRNGATGEVELVFDKTIGKYSDR